MIGSHVEKVHVSFLKALRKKIEIDEKTKVATLDFFYFFIRRGRFHGDFGGSSPKSLSICERYHIFNLP